MKVPAYLPPMAGKTRSGFLLRTVKELTGAVSRIRSSSASPAVSAGRLLFALLLVLLVSLARNMLFVWLVLAAYLVFLCVQPREKLLPMLAAPVYALGLSLLILLPSVLISPKSLVLIGTKIFVSAGVVSAAAVLGINAASALAYLRFPDMVCMVIGTALSSIRLLAETACCTLEALFLRYFGNSGRGRQALGGCAGIIFIRTVRHSEDLQRAMELRGFTGSYNIYRVKQQVLPFIPYLAASVLWAVIFWMTGRL